VIWTLHAPPASAQQLPPSAYPADNLFTATTCHGAPSFDPVGDVWSGTRDIVGDASYPAVYTYSDGTYMFIRIRLDGDPMVTTGGQPLWQFGWGIGIDTNGVLTDIEYHLVVNGIKEQVTLTREVDDTRLLTLEPTMDTSVSPFVPGWVEVKAAGDGSLFASDGDFFLTIALPMDDLNTASGGAITWSTLRFWAATSSNGTTLSGDFTCWADVPNVDPDLEQAAMDEVQVAPASCTNGVEDAGETDIDCGGSCPTAAT